MIALLMSVTAFAENQAILMDDAAHSHPVCGDAECSEASQLSDGEWIAVTSAEELAAMES